MKKGTFWNGSYGSACAGVILMAVLTGSGLFSPDPCLAQGIIFLRNAEPVYDVDGETPLGPGFWAQLYAAPIGSTALTAVGPPTEFLVPGYFGANEPVIIPGVPGGLKALGQVKVWRGSDGSSFEAANHPGGHVGVSEVFIFLSLGPPGSEGFDGVDFKSFSLYVVPEPPVAALTALGVVALRLFSARGRNRRRTRAGSKGVVKGSLSIDTNV